MSDIFASLACGTKFRGKQNQEARDIFRAKGVTPFAMLTKFVIALTDSRWLRCVFADTKNKKPVIDIFGDSDVAETGKMNVFIVTGLAIVG